MTRASPDFDPVEGRFDPVEGRFDPVTDPVRRRYDERDELHWKRLEDLVAGAGLTLKEILTHYPAFIQRRALPRVLAQYELFKQVVDLPGAIVEVGVYLGAGLFTWSNLLETFCPGDRTRRAIGFDHFRGYSAFSQKDGRAAPWIDKVLGPMQSSQALVQGLVDLHNEDNLLPGVERVRICDGDVLETIPAYARDNQGERISLLYLDIGLYEPTLCALQALYPLVITGGVVAFNCYGMRPWKGEAEAVETYFNGSPPAMRKFAFSTVPYAYFTKGKGS